MCIFVERSAQQRGGFQGHDMPVTFVILRILVISSILGQL